MTRTQRRRSFRQALLLLLLVACSSSSRRVFAATSPSASTRWLQTDGTPSEDALSSLVSQLQLNLPDFELVETILFSDLVVEATNVVCFDLQLESFQVTPSTDASTTTVSMQANLANVVCTLDYAFTYNVFLFPVSGSGQAQMILRDNTVSMALAFDNASPPQDVTWQECTANFQLVDMTFENDGSGSTVSSDILNSLDGLVRGFVEGDIGTTMCDEFGTAVYEGVSDVVQTASATLDPYLEANDSEPAVSLDASGVPSNVTLIDYTNVPASMASDDIGTLLTHLQTRPEWITTLLGQLHNLQLGEIDVATGDLRMNGILREYLLNDQQALVVTADDIIAMVNEFDPILFSDTNNTMAEIKMVLESVSLYGLNSFRQVDLLQTSAEDNDDPFTLHNHVQLDYLRLELQVRVTMDPSNQADSMIMDPNGALALDEQMTLTLQVDGVDAMASWLLAIHQEHFHQLQLGSVLFGLSSMLDCLISAVFQSEVTALQVTVADIAQPRLEGSFLDSSPMLQGVLTNTIQTGMALYKDALVTALPNLFQTRIRAMLNDAGFQKIPVDDTSTSCPQLAPTGGTWLDFRDLFLAPPASSTLGGSGSQPYGSLVPSLYRLVKGFVVENVSSLLGGALGADNGKDLHFPGELVADETRFWLGELDATVSYGVRDVRIENIDTIGSNEQIRLAEPVYGESSLLNHSASLGVVERPVRISARLQMGIASDMETFQNDFVLTADLTNWQLALATLLRVLEDRYATFPIRDMFHLECWMAMIPAPSLDEFGLRRAGIEPTAAVQAFSVMAQQLQMSLACIECTGSQLYEMAELWTTEEASRSMASTANDLIDAASSIANKFLTVELDRRLNDAAAQCPHSPQYEETYVRTTFQAIQVESTEDESSTEAIVLVIIIACAIAACGGAFFLLQCYVRRRHSAWLASLPTEKVALLARRQEEGDTKEKELNQMSSSMFQSEEEIPIVVRYLIPLIICGNIALFLSGHFSVAATVQISASFAGQTLNVEDVYAFSMARSAVEIWNAGGYVLSLGILVFAGIWPYTRQLLFMTLWFLPPTKCSISRRGSILLWLDALAKWSIVDIFTLVMTVAAFRLSIQNPATGFLPDKFYSMELLVVPVWGLYANLLAQLVSQISSHFIIHYHRKIYHHATKSYRVKHGFAPSDETEIVLPGTVPDSSSNNAVQSWDPYGDRQDSLYKHAFARPHRAETEKVVVRRFVNYAIVIGAIALCAFIIVGCVIPSVGLEFLGLLGVAVEFGKGGGDALQELSAFGLLRILMEQASFLSNARAYLGLGLLCAVIVITVLIVPFLQSAALLYQWFAMLSGKKRQRVAIAIETLQAWQYAEVYILSIIVSAWQLGSISEHLFNEYCESSTEMLNMLAYFGAIDGNDTQCFRTNASIMGGCYFMAAGALLLLLLNSYVNSATQQYFRSRDEEADHIPGVKKLEPCDTPATIQSSNDFISSEDNSEGDEELKGRRPEEKDIELDRQSDQPVYDNIRPSAVLFTDLFRWTLCGAATSPSR